MSDIVKSSIWLSGEELCEMNRNVEGFHVLPKGDKLEDPNDEQLEVKKSGDNLKNLYEMLKLERVLLSTARSKGIYEATRNRVKITKAAGRWSSFGYSEGGEVFLQSHEALLFMEMNRLELTYEGIPMSIEQGYAIFLGGRRSDSLTWEEYIVYSYLTRAGYALFLPNRDVDEEKFLNSQLRNEEKIEDQMIRSVLNENLNLPFSFDFVTSNYNLYINTKAAMKTHFDAIAGDIDFDKEQNMSYEPPCKKFKPFNGEQERNYLDILKAESEYLTYQEIYKKFGSVMRNEFAHLPDADEILKFSFDIYHQKSNFKRTEQLANYRLLVLSPKDKFPTNAQLEMLRKQQAYEVPIIIAIVSQSIQFSICTF